ncbi:MAG: DUF1415 domain-containing protein [Phaeodactylibacter sp.]|nr:DUF1415 domain-containing protein [Phaeodactylibacter sp.]MCB9050284.1 DUF1415 domain-containing protein [Lewinellaceae bacterium]
MQKEIEQTRRWLEKIVVGLNLCPFARLPFSTGRVRYVLYEGADMVALAKLMVQEAQYLSHTPVEEVETTLLILPNALPDFLDYLDFMDEAEWLIRENGLEGVIQVASFHPLYQFAGTESDAPENYTNRSPYPMLHLLREESIEQALEHYKDPEKIPEHNIEKMRELGLQGVRKLMEE